MGEKVEVPIGAEERIDNFVRELRDLLPRTVSLPQEVLKLSAVAVRDGDQDVFPVMRG